MLRSAADARIRTIAEAALVGASAAYGADGTYASGGHLQLADRC